MYNALIIYCEGVQTYAFEFKPGEWRCHHCGKQVRVVT